ncbi:bifunctional diguanylate cyclase/phosphodiesterase [Devosia submarina]|uniref:bifunctional diguanylate cyclase/phosphodiesterase n=1 Tax=Devosia submarina TaxID=1173082 RepID=UPI000D3C4B70|nr:EAL domain-containing protein [Devosia submarina]
MLTVLEKLLFAHDLRLVLLAALVCTLSAFAGFGLLVRARTAQGRHRLIWLGVAAIAVGFGIWSTHFIGMLAFHAEVPLGYDPAITALSLAVAILGCGLGFFLATHGNGRSDHLLAGTVVGLSITGMHYIGMAALVVGGEIGWDSALVIASVLLGACLAALALMVGATSSHAGHRLTAVGLLTLAICSMHFTAMAAVDLSNCFAVTTVGELSASQLSINVGLASVLILLAVLGGLYLDARDAMRPHADAARISAISTKLELALTHMSQGLVLFDGEERVVLVNAQLKAIFGIPDHHAMEGMQLRELCGLILQSRGDAPTTEQIDAVYQTHKHLMASEAGGEIVQDLASKHTVRIIHRPAYPKGWVSTVEDISERRKSEARIAHMAKHDDLTGLPNRVHFSDAAAAAIETADAEQLRLAVLGIDLDRFKEVNDNHGHAIGDTVLRMVADRVAAGLQDGEFFARVGGDEFAAFKLFKDEADLYSFISRLEDCIRTSLAFGELNISVGASIGLAIYPQDGGTLEKLNSNADLAMYRAKESVLESVCFYQASMDEIARERRSIARDLWNATENGQMFLHYQVQKSVSTNQIMGYEVLLRWNHPERGPISPAEFIPIAETCGAILPIGEWVLRTACRAAASWPEPHKIAVNLSAVQLANADLAQLVAAILVETGLNPSRLELEVTESAIIGDKQRALHILRQIRSLGVTIAIDDFGTGYSSLETLRSFPFDRIKLDRSFMVDVESNRQSKAIVRAILALGRSLEVPVLAEGVETSAQLELLSAEGCDEAQGYFLGRPGEWLENKAASAA